MTNETYFYKFLEPFTKELSEVARELESTIFTSPRIMLTHSRSFVENIIRLVIKDEKIEINERATFLEQLVILNEEGYLPNDVRDALHSIRQIGNLAAHEVRPFRFSEALLTWENLYVVVKWFVEVYVSFELDIPEYKDPTPQKDTTYDTSEIELRLQAMEKLLKNAMESSGGADIQTEPRKQSTTVTLPGYTPIRSITYKGESIEIPYFLRDVFLLPQRFDKSEKFLIRLGAEQQARIMSELPSDLEGLYKQVKSFSEKNDGILFNELKVFIEEEKARREVKLQRPGELFFFYKERHIIVTEEIAQISFGEDEISVRPSLLRQLKADQIEKVGQLPSELAILAKYEHVGIKTIESLFEQLERKQQGVLLKA
ncbi:DUF4145 domain-containing protein [Sporosarcina highlanderae]|uniref:DUF4145 domain-containing protein n=1 Tax=Sporosarcina highlanderae TaxID=3035916 RepID=A0ABT8JUH4_9BACL|nr:DUF4145 domain-containing protein [Sporosarcina highlanderae]MDN4608206.1 DUF4145 domain-containing protein [Sporosarcina highlanderae]